MGLSGLNLISMHVRVYMQLLLMLNEYYHHPIYAVLLFAVPDSIFIFTVFILF